jgi:hypothetical protein
MGPTASNDGAGLLDQDPLPILPVLRRDSRSENEVTGWVVSTHGRELVTLSGGMHKCVIGDRQLPSASLDGRADQLVPGLPVAGNDARECELRSASRALQDRSIGHDCSHPTSRARDELDALRKLASVMACGDHDRVRGGRDVIASARTRQQSAADAAGVDVSRVVDLCRAENADSPVLGPADEHAKHGLNVGQRQVRGQIAVIKQVRVER